MTHEAEAEEIFTSDGERVAGEGERGDGEHLEMWRGPSVISSVSFGLAADGDGEDLASSFLRPAANFLQTDRAGFAIPTPNHCKPVIYIKSIKFDCSFHPEADVEARTLVGDTNSGRYQNGKMLLPVIHSRRRDSAVGWGATQKGSTNTVPAPRRRTVEEWKDALPYFVYSWLVL